MLEDWIEQFEWKHDFVGALTDWPAGAAAAAGPEPEPASAAPSYAQLFREATAEADPARRRELLRQLLELPSVPATVAFCASNCLSRLHRVGVG